MMPRPAGGGRISIIAAACDTSGTPSVCTVALLQATPTGDMLRVPHAEKRVDSGIGSLGGRVWSRTLGVDENVDRSGWITRTEGLLLPAVQLTGSQPASRQLLQHQGDTEHDLLPNPGRRLEVFACTRICAVLRQSHRGYRRAPVRRLHRCLLLPERTPLVPRSRVSLVLRRCGRHRLTRWAMSDTVGQPCGTCDIAGLGTPAS